MSSTLLLRNIDPRNFWKHKLPNVTLVNNHEFYCSLIRDKKILHVGCTDHKELIDLKIKENNYLHMKLMKYAQIVHGVDINKDAIKYLHDKHDISNIFYYDITESEIPNKLFKSYDIILIPEVVEHISNLGIFLKSVKKFMSSKSILLIGVPNSTKLHNFLTILKNYEENNPDHKYYFSYVTLKCLLEQSGFVIDKWHVYIYGNPKRKLFKYGVRSIQKLIKSLFIEINPWFADGIIVQCRLLI